MTELPPLLTTCKACGGTGRPPDRSPAMTDANGNVWMTFGRHCESCDGAGRVPTEAGYAVLELVRLATYDTRPVRSSWCPPLDTPEAR